MPFAGFRGMVLSPGPARPLPPGPPPQAAMMMMMARSVPAMQPALTPLTRLNDKNLQLGPQQHQQGHLQMQQQCHLQMQQQYHLQMQQQAQHLQALRQHVVNQAAPASKEQKLPEALLPAGTSRVSEKQDLAPSAPGAQEEEELSPTLSCCCAHGLEVPRVLHGTRDSEDRTAPAAEEPAPEADSDFKEEDLDGSLFTAADDLTGGKFSVFGVIKIINDSLANDEPSEPPRPALQRSEPRARPSEPPITGAATQDARQDKVNLKPCAQCKKNRKGVNHCISKGHAALKAESNEEEEEAELAEKIADPATVRIKFTVGDSFPPDTVVVVTPGEMLADAQDEEFQVGK